ncbi:hypothetical protein RUM44_003517 [Polyplax serrata]|uniref:LAGLIDADG homing endonuclease n=1 Tax=Polyplax serrata TaxID=468196 RepID=A0ABR1AGP9_POLSC
MGNLDFNDWTKVRVGQIFNFGSGVLENTRRRKGSNEMDFGSWARKPTWESRVGTFALLSQLHIAEMRVDKQLNSRELALFLRKYKRASSFVRLNKYLEA